MIIAPYANLILIYKSYPKNWIGLIKIEFSIFNTYS